MNKTYNYSIEGTGGDGQTWTTTGTVTCGVDDMFMSVMRDSFDKLTSGRAIYGRPGVGCQGPYDMHKIVIEQVKQ